VCDVQPGHETYSYGLPPELVPQEPQAFTLDKRRSVEIHCFAVGFHASQRPLNLGLNERYAVRTQVELGGHAMFPELALLALFQREGWKGVWADTQSRKYYTSMPHRSKGVTLDPFVSHALARISTACGAQLSWDLLLWHEKLLLTALVRGPGEKARLKTSQAAWLEAALRSGFSMNQFMLIEWRVETARERQSRTVVIKRRPRKAPKA
jgi:hypothetical protein